MYAPGVEPSEGPACGLGSGAHDACRRGAPGPAASPLFDGIADGEYFYFTHSYAVADDADAADVLARTHYTRSFPCIVRHGNVWGCQFHPEKSSALGQRILKNFVNIVEEAGR